MRILAVDTSTTTCSVAVSEEGALVAELTLAGGRTHSRHLMGLVDQLLATCGLTLDDIDAFAAVRGPGSFTGLRIGLSMVKGLSFATGKPAVGVSSLTALACQFPWTEDTLCMMLDARKGEVYCGTYRFVDGALLPERVGEEAVIAPGQAAGAISGDALFAGSGAVAYREVIEGAFSGSARFAPANLNTIGAGGVALLAFERLSIAGESFDDSLKPRYIRKSDAELNFGMKKLRP